MRISTLIAKLESIQEDHGDIWVEDGEGVELWEDDIHLVAVDKPKNVRVLSVWLGRDE